MAGSTILDSSYRYANPKTGVYGTKADHTKADEAAAIKAPYSAGAPSAGAASTAARGVNPNLDFNVGPTGNTSLSNSTEMQRQLVEFQNKMNTDNAALQRSNTLSDRNSLLSAMNKPAAPQPVVQHGSVKGNEGDARALAFSNAKAQAGKIARSSLTAISEQMAGRGVSGGGMQALEEAGAIGTAGGALQDFTRDQMMSDVNREAEISDLDYAGKVTQRGQDLNNRQSYLSLLSGLY